MTAAFAGYSRHTVGLLLLLGVVFIWVDTRQTARKRSRSDDALDIQSTSIDPTPAINASSTQYHRDENIRNRSEEGTALVHPSMANGQAQSSNNDAALEKLTMRETVKLGVAFSILWFAANVTQNASLAYTSVASSSILCSTSGLFTLVIGYVASVEKFNTTRLTAVLASILGVYCIIKYGSHETSNMSMSHSWIGDFLALLSAALYGCYTILLKRQIGDESRLDAPLFFGVVGLANTLLLWPGFIILHFSGVETFQLPHSQSIWAMILVNAFIGTFLSDYLWLLAMLMTSPLVVTLGLSLTIPLSMAGDVLFKGFSVSFPYYVGALLVLGAFIGVNF
ncbi:hypothetical protein IWW36_005031 [Coemansia brasiliensis]|uniref:EamA domain-containing protein n=1 Tax=Coemansia brasiliensis TaxID=2650707 RepID=A0A9W8I4K0_9FUNG|nr:hypothetical protein IWW36_005031 [Coemansia brasiliensis]